MAAPNPGDGGAKLTKLAGGRASSVSLSTTSLPGPGWPSDAAREASSLAVTRAHSRRPVSSAGLRVGFAARVDAVHGRFPGGSRDAHVRPHTRDLTLPAGEAALGPVVLGLPDAVTPHSASRGGGPCEGSPPAASGPTVRKEPAHRRPQTTRPRPLLHPCCCGGSTPRGSGSAAAGWA